ncbi:hypothetical protein [Sphaerisporangium fuscum]|uniref:hypothetical protein n=1 Tax=Sphaerisporangium fuscum TaxID=2835868 RepID=UPI001BDC9047|nr:hypothetical protein [Sphaerisporangium fuscum]
MILNILYYLPTLIVLIVGIVLTARAKREHGSGATLGMIGCIVLLLTALLEAVRALALPYLLTSGGYSARGPLITLSGLLFAIFNTIGIGLLIWGVVAKRIQTQSAAPGWQPPQGQGWQQPAPGWQQQPPGSGWQQQPPQPPAPGWQQQPPQQQG